MALFDAALADARRDPKPVQRWAREKLAHARLFTTESACIVPWDETKDVYPEEGCSRVLQDTTLEHGGCVGLFVMTPESLQAACQLSVPRRHTTSISGIYVVFPEYSMAVPKECADYFSMLLQCAGEFTQLPTGSFESSIPQCYVAVATCNTLCRAARRDINDYVADRKKWQAWLVTHDQQLQAYQEKPLQERVALDPVQPTWVMQDAPECIKYKPPLIGADCFWRRYHPACRS
jgi:hypothetical protein